MVKFTKELKYNAIEEWRAHYVKYAQLKKLIYGEEKHQVAKTTTSGRKSGVQPQTAAFRCTPSAALARQELRVAAAHECARCWLEVMVQAAPEMTS